ncbi:hypothetical protein [Lacticaseibacillus paracasei]|uniref:hypothetical protein n=1 Tax=Lacticaseibacillus paracasei TaxID=1597 RepID=UPI003CFEB537
MFILRYLAKGLLISIGIILLFISYVIGFVAKVGGTLMYIISTSCVILVFFLSFKSDMPTNVKLILWAATIGMTVFSALLSVLPEILSSSAEYLMELL